MRKKILFTIIFLAFLAGLIIMSFYHENWRDEAQAFLLCRDMNFFDFFKNIHYEGHPIFYYLFLFPLVKLGFGPKSVNILSFVFMSIAVYLIIFKTDLKSWKKIVLILNYPVLYEFSVIGRSYSLVFLLLIIFGIIYPKRFEKPISFAIVLGCLLNTHLLMVGFVVFNIVLYIYELLKSNRKLIKKRSLIIASIVISLFFIILIISFYPVLLGNNSFSFNFIDYLNVLAILTFCVTFEFSIIKVLILSICIIIIFIYIFLNDKKMFLLLLFNQIYMSLLLYIKVPITPYFCSLSYVLLLIILFFVVFKEKTTNKYIMFAIILITILSIIKTVDMYIYDIKYDYSTGKTTAVFIKKNISKDSIFLCNADSVCSTFIPYINNKFYHLNSNRYFTYIIWDKEREKKIDLEKIKKFISKNKNVYYIYINTGYEDDIKFLDNMKEYYSLKSVYIMNEKNYCNERYEIYKIERKKYD